MKRLFLKHFRSLFQTGFRGFEWRIVFVMICVCAAYGALAGRLVQLGVKPDASIEERRVATHSVGERRPDVLDRNGLLLATDIDVASMYAEPRRILDVDEATELLTAVLPDMNARDLRDKLASKKGFVWLRRELKPKQQAEIHRLGLPGIGFIKETKRVYPNGTTLAHIVGAVDVDNKGISGMERTIDVKEWGKGQNPAPIQLSVDLRAQHVMRDELMAAKEKFSAIGASGMIFDVDTGEIVSLVSLPDYDPNIPAQALDPNNINRMMVGVYEMGSTFKALTTAMALDSGKVGLNSSFDARGALYYGKFKISDFHAQNRIMSVPDIFIHSSNIGSAKMALAIGVEGHKSFLRKMGILDRVRTELPESSAPLYPKQWGELNTVTIAFGHGLSVAPMQAVMATGALINGGLLVKPTVLKRAKEDALPVTQRVIKTETSDKMRYLMRLNAEKGTATKANVPGYLVGGKTGTAEKVIGGRYAKNRLMTSFMGAFPMDKPKYVVLVMLDEPKGIKETHGFATSGWNASPATGRIIERVAPVLGIVPRHDPFEPAKSSAEITATIIPATQAPVKKLVEKVSTTTQDATANKKTPIKTTTPKYNQ